MAWNGSDKEKVRVRGEGEQRKGSYSSVRPASARGPYRGLVAGLIVVALGCGAVWWFFGRGRSPSVPQVGSRVPRDRTIAEVAPDIATNKVEAAEVAEAKPAKPDPNARPTELGQVLNGYVMTGSGLHKIYGEITNTCSIKGDYEIFKHSAENTIACLLSLKAGDNLVGEPVYDGAFKASLERSLKDPIKIEETDTPEQVELKQAVIEAKAELKKAMDRGEDVEQIVLDARRECQELARAKQMMMSDVFEFVDKKAVTSADVETYVEAANKLLESKGIAPIDRTTLVDIKLRHKLEDWDPEVELEKEEAEEDK